MDKRSLIFMLAATVALLFLNQYFTSVTSTKPSTPPPASEIVASPPLQKRKALANEQLYVIENAYQQVVISSIGGAIAEINLPFQSKENEQSLVHPIELDRIIETRYAKNALFPLKNYSSSTGTHTPKVGGYSPLLRRNCDPELYAMNTISEDPALAEAIYRITRLEPTLIELEASMDHRKIVKTYQFAQHPDKAPYMIHCTLRIEGDTRDIQIMSGVPEVELISGSAAPALQYRRSTGNKVKVEKISLPKKTTSYSTTEPDWISNGNGFFGIILDPLSDIGAGFKASLIPGEIDPTRLSVIDPEYDQYPVEKYPGYAMSLPFPQTSKPVEFRLFAGPYATDILKQIDTYYTEHGANPDYVGSQSFHGWFSFISGPFATFLFFLMKAFYSFTYSWGLSIILLTIALRIMMYPLNNWSTKSMAKMQEIAPEIEKVDAKYKKDPQRAQMEKLKLYKEYGTNPFSGCLPMLIQIPFLMGMFDLLKSTFELRGASFIPGWISDLAAPDSLFTWSRPIFFFGTSLHLLPFLLGGAMYLQQHMTNRKNKGKVLSDQQKQQQKMGSYMTIVFTFMFYSFPSGLNIYWLSSTLLGILQMEITQRKMSQCKLGKIS